MSRRCPEVRKGVGFPWSPGLLPAPRVRRALWGLGGFRSVPEVPHLTQGRLAPSTTSCPSGHSPQVCTGAQRRQGSCHHRKRGKCRACAPGDCEVFLPVIETVSVARVQNAELERPDHKAGLKVSSKANPSF